VGANSVGANSPWGETGIIPTNKQRPKRLGTAQVSWPFSTKIGFCIHHHSSVVDELVIIKRFF